MGAEILPARTTEPPLLVEFARLWRRGLADEAKLWELFDLSELYLQRPEYFGAPLFKAEGQLVTPVFSTLDRLTEFVRLQPALGPASGALGFDWARMSGRRLLELPVRARLLLIDPGHSHAAEVDLAQRRDPSELAGRSISIAVDLELADDGRLVRASDPTTPQKGEHRS